MYGTLTRRSIRHYIGTHTRRTYTAFHPHHRSHTNVSILKKKKKIAKKILILVMLETLLELKVGLDCM